MGDETYGQFRKHRQAVIGGRPPDLDKARAERRAGLAQDIADGLICDTPAARTSDPETSHEAADRMRASGTKAAHQKLIADKVHALPGLTYRELAMQCGLERHAVGRRLKELETAKRIRRGESREVDGQNYTTWWPR